MSPLYIALEGSPGHDHLNLATGELELRPLPADLEQLELTAHTPAGPIEFSARGRRGARELTIRLPAGCEGELILNRQERVSLEPAQGAAPAGHCVIACRSAQQPGRSVFGFETSEQTGGRGSTLMNADPRRSAVIRGS